MAKYFEPYVEDTLDDDQCGFHRRQFITDKIFSLRMILEKSYEYNADIHPLYIDHKQAYNSIDKDQFTKIVKEFRIPSKLVRLVRNDTGKTNKVKIQGKMLPSFETVVGLRQGNALPTVFIYSMYGEG